MPGELRHTKQKQAILEALDRLDHPTATEVYEYVRKCNPSLSRGTVFRVLGGFAERGLVRKLSLAESDARFDVTTAPHAHGVCRVCGRVCDLPLPALAPVAAGSMWGGFHVDGCEVQFTGICQDCSKANMRQSAQIK